MYFVSDVVDFIRSSVNIIDCIATMSFYIDLVPEFIWQLNIWMNELIKWKLILGAETPVIETGTDVLETNILEINVLGANTVLGSYCPLTTDK